LTIGKTAHFFKAFIFFKKSHTFFGNDIIKDQNASHGF